MEFNIKDFNQCDKLVRSISVKEYTKYLARVVYSKLELDDFYQNGWVAMQDCINKGVSNLDYICVAIRNSIYRGVRKTSIIQTEKKSELWFYISGHETRLESPSSEDGLTIGELVPARGLSVEQEVENLVLIGQVLSSLNENDREELIRLRDGKPPKRRKLRETAKKRAYLVLNGENPYKNKRSEYQSDIIGVTYDKSKNRWVFSKKINGKTKTFIRDREQSVVEDYAKKYYENII